MLIDVDGNGKNWCSRSRLSISNDQTVGSKDTLLFYFSGHGVPDAYGDTYIAISETDPDFPALRGISFEDLTKWMTNSVSKRIVVFLDCCFSGAANVTAKGEEAEAEAAKLASASRIEKQRSCKKEKESVSWLQV